MDLGEVKINQSYRQSPTIITLLRFLPGAAAFIVQFVSQHIYLNDISMNDSNHSNGNLTTPNGRDLAQQQTLTSTESTDRLVRFLKVWYDHL